MNLHGQTFTPSDVTRLVIEHASGTLDLRGAEAVAAIREIRRHRETSSARIGRPPGRKVDHRPAVLEVMRGGGEMTRGELAVALGLAPGTVSRVLLAMIAEGTLAEGRTAPVPIGQPRKTYTLG